MFLNNSGHDSKETSGDCNSTLSTGSTSHDTSSKRPHMLRRISGGWADATFSKSSKYATVFYILLQYLFTTQFILFHFIFLFTDLKRTQIKCKHLLMTFIVLLESSHFFSISIRPELDTRTVSSSGTAISSSKESIPIIPDLDEFSDEYFNKDFSKKAL